MSKPRIVLPHSLAAPPGSLPHGRRAFLARTLAGAGALWAACGASEPRAGFLGAMRDLNEGLERSLFSTSRVPLVEDPPTALEAFPVYHIAPMMPVAPADWRLAVGGSVARPASFSLADLQRLARTDLRMRHHCVEGWTAVADWHGLQLRTLADIVGVDPRAAFVEFHSFDMGYHSSWDLESALHPQTLLAYGMNQAPLTPAHGAPVRLYGSVKLGYKQVKYLTAVNFLDHPTGGFWEDQGYEWYAGV